MKTALLLAALFVGSGIFYVFSTDRNESISGEGVYVAEGCIHCHSQFSRIESLDTNIYGPPSLPDDQEGGAILIGNRRQGPDLSSVGLRRSRQWNREHLIAPGLVSPGTRMPSYRHLFELDGERGEALLDYLAGLGASGAQAWVAETSAWKMALGEGDASRGGVRFQQLCQQCHGRVGDGTGVLAERFDPRPSNFVNGGFRFAPETLPVAVRREQLARIVKYGIGGTAMAGHEYLTDGDIADLVSYVSGFSVRPESTE